MKLTHTNNVKATKSGMTLLELTVVILVLLSLISILFIGARAWKKGSDRAASILQIRNVQQAVRSFSNMNGLNPGDGAAAIDAKVTPTAPLPDHIFGAGKFIENDPTAAPPVGGHPAGSLYSYTFVSAGVIPIVGDLYMEVAGPVPADYMPAANTTNDW